MLNNYVLMALKVYQRRKLFTAINLLCIVLTLVVLMVVTALLQNAFYPRGVEGKSERFLQIGSMVKTGNNGNVWNSPLGYKLIDKYLRPMKSVAQVAAVTTPQVVSVYQQDHVTQLKIRRADAGYWKILDFNVVAGRVPTEQDVEQGRFVAVLNATSARKLFPDAKALGQSLNIAGQTFQVIGVVEDVLQLNSYADIWAPVTTFPSSEYRNQLSGDFTALLMGNSPADLPLIQAEVEQVAKQVVFDDPKQWDTVLIWADSKLDFIARSLLGNGRSADSGAAAMMTGIVVVMFLFMLLPALNLVNLNAGRIMERSSEIGVRKAFGASSNQLVAQLVIENILLSLVAGLLGFACSAGVLIWLERSGLIPYLKVEINLPIFLWGLLITLVFGLLSGVIPAWKMSRLDPVFALKGIA